VDPLMTLETAKVHLRITDTAHDTDVQMKLTDAQDAILDYLGEQVNPLWTEATAPPRVLAAIRMYLTHLYEHRGDDMSGSGAGSTSDAAVWSAIRNLLARTRMQAIGVGLEETPETTPP
jgi:Phage gp6-like head-tail connector protein